MNLLQIIRRARFEADAIRAAGTTSALWSDEEMVGVVNNAVDRAYRIMRLAGNTRIMRSMISTDAAIDLIVESYAPSSLRLADGTTNYTLPPDLVSVAGIRPVTLNFEAVRFRPTEPNSADYLEDRATPDSSLVSVESDTMTYHYIIIGERTIQYIPEPRDVIDIELLYFYRPPRLLNYTTGTITATNASTAVTGAGGTDWLVYGLRPPAELVVSATTVTIDRHYPRISTIDSATGLTLQRTYQGSTVVGAAYAVSMVPQLPEEHHEWLAQMSAAIMLRKTSLDDSMKAVATLEQELLNEVTSELTRRQIQESHIIPPFEIAD